MSNNLEDSDEYRHLIAQGVPADGAWAAVWIDRAYTHLVKSGMDGAAAYAQAVSVWAARRLDLEAESPETAIHKILGDGFKAQQMYPTLDPRQPEASFIVQHQTDPERKPS